VSVVQIRPRAPFLPEMQLSLFMLGWFMGCIRAFFYL